MAETLTRCIYFLGLQNKVPQPGWLKQHKFILLQFWRLEVWYQTVGRATLSLKLQGKILPCLFLACGSCWQSLVFLGLWQNDSSLCLCHHMADFAVCLFSSSSYKDTNHIGLRAHPTPVWCHFHVPNYICNYPISKWAHFWGSGNFRRTLFNPVHSPVWFPLPGHTWRSHLPASLAVRLGPDPWVLANSMWAERCSSLPGLAMKHLSNLPHAPFTYQLVEFSESVGDWGGPRRWRRKMAKAIISQERKPVLSESSAGSYLNSTCVHECCFSRKCQLS